MHTRSYRQLLTCRYWALGPCCPNIDLDNIQICQFAHWDTGQLADIDEQRGTCFDWFHKGFCIYGSRCSDDHRDTGVMGLNRGMLMLHGLNLEVADAANKAGFNTQDQVALTELIWAVRRVAFRHAADAPQISRPPKHPVYPDHYRPGDPSDNTRRKRKRRKEPTKKAPNARVSAANLVEFGPGDVAEGKNAIQANSSAKRLKAAVSHMGRYKVELPERPRPDQQKYQTEPASLNDVASMPKDCSLTIIDTTNRIASPRPRNLLSPSPTPGGPSFEQCLSMEPRSHDLTVVQLDQVKSTLKNNIASVLKLSSAMMQTYNSDDRLSNDVIYAELGILKTKFDSCAKGAEDGIKVAEKVISLLGNEQLEDGDVMGSTKNLITFGT